MGGLVWFGDSAGVGKPWVSWHLVQKMSHLRFRGVCLQARSGGASQLCGGKAWVERYTSGEDGADD